MRPAHAFRKLALLAAALLFAVAVNLRAQTEPPAPTATAEGPAWRTWTSSDGAQIEAFLKDVLPGGIVIVRRDGREFTAPLSRFSEADQKYVATWAQSAVPNADDFRQLDFSAVALPDEYLIEDVENLRPDSQEPFEAAALRTILNYHNMPFSENLVELLKAREPEVENEAIPASGLVSVLANLPVQTEILLGQDDPEEEEESAEIWEANLNAIRTALTKNLPVLMVYRPYFEPETLESVVVAVGYDESDMQVLETTGGNDAVPLNLESLARQFVYALILFPTPEVPGAVANAAATAPSEPTREFLSQISSAIMTVPAYEPTALTEFLQEMGIQATMRDVNRADLQTQMGQTRSFARSGGLPAIDASLARGNVIIVPLELDSGQGFALIYGATEESYLGVEFLSDRTFRRAPIPRGELAERWLTRDNRTYRLDLIEITVPPGGGPVPPPPPTERPPAGGPPTSRPPPPPRR